MSFSEQLGRDYAWRQDLAGRLKLLTKWIERQGLCNAAVKEKLQRLHTQISADKLVVAFAAQGSRGKSELINALFFADHGSSFLPADPGRTTMCPTELGYEPGLAPCLRLLPIETRLESRTLADWRLVPDKWLHIDLDANDAAQLGACLQKVTEVSHVSVGQARALGFWSDSSPLGNSSVGRAGQVQIPKWRHALVNIAHPLLEQGLVILDMPGLTAVGVEPELTGSLVSQADAVVFILAADTGVTQSDLAIWNGLVDDESNAGKAEQTRLVVLNKIDALWDDLRTGPQIQAQIDRRRSDSASVLGLPQSRIIAVSAQKALVAKITKNQAMLQASELPVLERLLGQHVTAQRQNILYAAAIACCAAIKSEASRGLDTRQHELALQLLELRGLKSKSSGVLGQLRSRIAQEQADFAGSSVQIQAVRFVNHDLLGRAVDLLGVSALKAELAELQDALKQPGIKLRLKSTYSHTFSQLCNRMQQGHTAAAEIQTMLESAFRQLNADFGFSVQIAPAPDLMRHVHDLNLIENSHLKYFGLGNAIRLVQLDFSDQLVRALGSRLRVVFEHALSELDVWSKAAFVLLDTQVQKRCQNTARRIEAVERIQAAGATLDARIAELEHQEARQKTMESRLAHVISRFLDFQPALPAENRSFDTPAGFVPVARPV